MHSIEIVGGGSRIPAFQALGSSVFETTLLRTLNASEAVSRGACMMSAYISPLFKVMAYGVEDKNQFCVKAAFNFVEAGVPL